MEQNTDLEPIHSQRNPVAAMLYNGMIGLVSPETIQTLGLSGFRELEKADVILNRRMHDKVDQLPAPPPIGMVRSFVGMLAKSAPQPISGDRKEAACNEEAELIRNSVILNPKTQLLTVRPDVHNAKLKTHLEVVLANIAEVVKFYESDPGQRPAMCQEIFQGLLQRAVNTKGNIIGGVADAAATHRALVTAHLNSVSGRGATGSGRQ